MKPSLPSQPLSAPVTWLTATQFQEFQEAETTAHRLGSGPDGWVERLGDDALVSYKHEAALEQLLAGLALQGRETGWLAARIFVRFLPIRNAERIAPVLHHGDDSLPLTSVVSEAGVLYEINLAAGYSHGLFLDQRLNRAKLRALAPKRLLNAFAYTCSFTVAAALAGAETLSVDLSQLSLDRGRRNLQLNGLSEKGHRFEAGDVLELLPRLECRNERFDAIILDPPTFSRGENGRRWQVEDHFEDLLDAALEVAAPTCSILLSTNCTKLDTAEMERRARSCAKHKRRAATYLKLSAPIDFPPGHGSSTLWMMVR